jgi:ActR/RegA family two-component response regulator
MPNLSYAVATMRLLCLTQDCSVLHQVARVFSEHIVELQCHENSEAFLGAHANAPWDAYFVDFDFLTNAGADPFQFVDQLGPARKMIVAGSANFADWHDQARRYGAVVLDKPITAGEIGLALRRLGDTES